MNKDIVNQVTEALDNATPGPWRVWERSDSVQVIEKNGHTSICEMDGGTYEEWRHNAHLIVNAPTWLRQLVTEVERLRATVK